MRSLSPSENNVVILVLWVGLSLIIPALLAGCGDKDTDGIEVVIRADFSSPGIGDADFYPDAFLDPSKFTIGLKSVKLIKADETSPSYEIFDTEDATDPLVLELAETAQRADLNPVFPTGCPCEFSKVQIELIYSEIEVPVYQDDTAINRSIRFYTLDLTDPDLGVMVTAGDVLIGDQSSPPNFSWIDTKDGKFISLSLERPGVHLQVPESRFPDDQYSSIVTFDLSPFLKISDDPEGTSTITLTFEAGALFFYDETDEPDNGRFDRFTDGRLNANDPASHYYPTFPVIKAAS